MYSFPPVSPPNSPLVKVSTLAWPQHSTGSLPAGQWVIPKPHLRVSFLGLLPVPQVGLPLNHIVGCWDFHAAGLLRNALWNNACEQWGQQHWTEGEADSDAVATEASARWDLWSWKAPAELSQPRQGAQDFVSPTMMSRGVGINLGETASFTQGQLQQRVPTISQQRSTLPASECFGPKRDLMMNHSTFNRSFTTHFVPTEETLPHTEDGCEQRMEWAWVLYTVPKWPNQSWDSLSLNFLSK